VKIDGEALPREHHLLAAHVVKAANRIAAARLVYADGAPAAGDFPLSNAETFLPGRAIEILAGAESEPESLFKGIVVRQALRVRTDSAPQLVVECRHRATRLTVHRRSASFVDQRDSEIIAALLERASVEAEVDETELVHPQQVQHRATDWDFLVSRAEANGRFVLARGDALHVKKPALDATPVCTLQFGATILELDAEVDARLQLASVTGESWDPAQQKVVATDAAEPGAAGPGNLKSADLAKAASDDGRRLAHVAIGADEARAWAEAEWLKSRLAKVSGRIKCDGIATVDAGHVVALRGAGDRFTGDVLVTGVRQTLDAVEGWKTHVQFGATTGWLARDADVPAPRAGGLLPSVSGLQIGTVESNEDDTGEHRVRVRLPLDTGDGDGIWARVAAVDAGNERGFFFRPEVGDEVVLGFLDADPRQAVILGMLHSSAKPPPLEGSDDNHRKIYQSRSKLVLAFDDDAKSVRIATPAGNSIALDESGKSIAIEDQNGNRIALDENGITIESRKAITLKSGTELALESGTELRAKAGTQLALEGAAGAKLSSSATTTVRGSVVQIN
jgi:Rhs element Vgr protein